MKYVVSMLRNIFEVAAILGLLPFLSYILCLVFGAHKALPEFWWGPIAAYILVVVIGHVLSILVSRMMAVSMYESLKKETKE